MKQGVHKEKRGKGSDSLPIASWVSKLLAWSKAKAE